MHALIQTLNVKINVAQQGDSAGTVSQNKPPRTALISLFLSHHYIVLEWT